MPKFNVLRSVNIQAPIDNIYKILINFNHWQKWSPWLVMEPEAKVQISGDGKYYQWFGKRVGEGNMQILVEQKNNKIDYSLNFVKPWKSKAKVSFILSENDNSVDVTWTMHSNLPFFLFWMKRMMVAFISSDYDRGLSMLKSLVENGEVPSKLEFKGVNKSPYISYIGIKTKCSQAEIGECMNKDFIELRNYIQEHPDLKSGQAFSIYHHWDIVKGLVEYTAAIPVSDPQNVVSTGFVLGEIPATKTYTIRHIGPYDYVGNAWSTLYNMQQNKEIKCNKRIHPFEVYLNDPTDTAPDKLITEVNFPLK